MGRDGGDLQAMKIAILDGSDRSDGRFDGYLGELAASLRAGGCEVERLVLRDLDLRRCTGCFGCWLTTPGRCVSPDDHGRILRAYVRSDVVVFASPLRMGFTSARLKLATEKLLPAVLPYVDTSTGECRHVMRYPGQPRLAVLVEEEPGTTADDHALVAEMYRRLARNAHTRLLGYHAVSTPSEEVSRALADA
jgi:MinD superfamily P-loop ATPase